MKLKTISAAIVALAAAAAFGTSAHAQNLTYNTSGGDLFIGFEQTGSANNYVVDLGSVSQFLSTTTSLSFALSASDLSTAFGSSWSSNSQTNLVQWGVIGGSNKNSTQTLGGNTLVKNTLFYTQGELNPGTPADAPVTKNNASQNATNGQIVAFATDFGSETPAAGSTAALQATIESKATSGSYGDEQAQSTFGLGFSIEQPLSGSATGPTNSTLDLFRSNAGSTGALAIDLGTFQLSNSGVLTFTSAAAAPEPSSYALAALAAVTFLVLRRRQAISGQ